MELCFLSNLSPADIAAAVQAGGSILAIVAVYHGTLFSMKMQKRQRRLAVRAILHATHEHISSIAQMIQMPHDGFYNPNPETFINYNKDITAGYFKAIESIEFSDLKSSSEIDSILLLKKHLTLLGSTMETFMNGIYHPDNPFDKVAKIEKGEFTYEVRNRRYTILQSAARNQTEFCMKNINILLQSLD